MLVILWRVVAGGLGSDEFNDGLAEEFDEVVDEKGKCPVPKQEISRFRQRAASNSPRRMRKDLAARSTKFTTPSINRISSVTLQLPSRGLVIDSVINTSITVGLDGYGRVAYIQAKCAECEDNAHK